MTTNVAAPRPPSQHDRRARILWGWILPAVLLAFAYSLLGLTLVEHPGHAALMSRCVLMDDRLSRIWSVGHIEIALSYLGVFLGMVYHLTRVARKDKTHLTDLMRGFLYVIISFALDTICVAHFQPFTALFIGDVVVMTFTACVSRQFWFQRLLGVFVPLVFLTCSVGHFMEGLSFWKLTYPLNVPWTMVTGDVGFAVLVNAARFPAFIRGQDLVNELDAVRAEATARQEFVRDVMLSATQGRLRLADSVQNLPDQLATRQERIVLTRETLGQARHAALAAAYVQGFRPQKADALQTAVGEATMNAVVHGAGGTCSISSEDRKVQVRIEDMGTGIQWTELPKATLERGYSTRGSLGHGFWLILQCVDRIDLHTSTSGTILVLTVHADGPFAQQGSPMAMAELIKADTRHLPARERLL
jgi:anti-sigma regulatory factor (Ser/Thr protein kinase)